MDYPTVDVLKICGEYASADWRFDRYFSLSQQLRINFTSNTTTEGGNYILDISGVPCPEVRYIPGEYGEVRIHTSVCVL